MLVLPRMHIVTILLPCSMEVLYWREKSILRLREIITSLATSTRKYPQNIKKTPPCRKRSKFQKFPGMSPGIFPESRGPTTGSDLSCNTISELTMSINSVLIFNYYHSQFYGLSFHFKRRNERETLIFWGCYREKGSSAINDMWKNFDSFWIFSFCHILNANIPRNFCTKCMKTFVSRRSFRVILSKTKKTCSFFFRVHFFRA